MRVRHVGHGIRGFDRIAALGALWDALPPHTRKHLEILQFQFFEQHGLEATLDASGVCSRTPHRREAALKPRTVTPRPQEAS